MSFLNLVFRIYVVAAALPVLGLIILLLMDTYSHKRRSPSTATHQVTSINPRDADLAQ